MDNTQLPPEIPEPKIPGTVGKGWHNLVIDLHHQLKALVPDYELQQIKEKFGGLRYYTSFPNSVQQEKSDKFYALVEQYEAKSLGICELCGQEGFLVSNGGWFKTLCKEHSEKTSL